MDIQLSRILGSLLRRMLATLLAVVHISTGSAQEPTDAERRSLADSLLSEGIEAFKDGQYTDAANFYRESIQAWPTDLAAANLCNLTLYGQGVEQSYEDALRLCLAAAEMGNANAYIMLGEMYLLGRGVDVDRAKALGYYRGGADMGHAHGQFVLGAILAKSNDPEGLEWLSKAASQGHTGASDLLESLATE